MFKYLTVYHCCSRLTAFPGIPEDHHVLHVSPGTGGFPPWNLWDWIQHATRMLPTIIVDQLLVVHVEQLRIGSALHACYSKLQDVCPLVSLLLVAMPFAFSSFLLLVAITLHHCHF